MNTDFEIFKKKLINSESANSDDSQEQRDLILILELLKKANIFNRGIFNWLMTLEPKKIDNLKRDLTVLNEYQVLNESYLPLFIYYINGKFDLTANCIPFLKSRHTKNYLSTYTQAILFGQLISKIETQTLKQKFIEFETLINHYLKAQAEVKHTTDLNHFFINLIQCRLLTPNRLQKILNNADKITNIIAAFRLEPNTCDFVDQNDIAIHQEFFEILLLHTLDPATPLHWEVVEIIQKHIDDFRNVYSRALIMHPQPRLLWKAIIKLNNIDGLNLENFAAIGTEHPLTKAKIIDHLIGHEVTIKDKLDVIKRYPCPRLLQKKLVHISRQLETSEFESELIDELFKLLSDRMEIIERTQMLAMTTQNGRQTFFSLLPQELLQMTAACSHFAAHTTENAMKIVLDNWTEPQAQPSSQAEPIEDVSGLYP